MYVTMRIASLLWLVFGVAAATLVAVAVLTAGPVHTEVPDGPERVLLDRGRAAELP